MVLVRRTVALSGQRLTDVGVQRAQRSDSTNVDSRQCRATAERTSATPLFVHGKCERALARSAARTDARNAARLHDAPRARQRLRLVALAVLALLPTPFFLILRSVRRGNE